MNYLEKLKLTELIRSIIHENYKLKYSEMAEKVADALLQEYSVVARSQAEDP